MQRTQANLEKYHQTCKKVMERADNICEVMVDIDGYACTNGRKHRCLKYIPFDSVTYTNFLHTETRNGKPDEWTLDPENVILGCNSHHYEEERTGIRVERYNYEDLNYVPEYE